MDNKIYTVEEIQNIIMPIAKRYRLTQMYLFGSYARGEADSSSDIDLRTVGGDLHDLFSLGGLYSDLEKALNKPLDIVMTESLRQNKHDSLTQKLIRNIRKDEKLIYERLTSEKY